MKIARGNIWDHPAPIKCITTNGIVKADGRLVMGKGVALQAAERYPGLDLALGRYVTQYGNRPCYFQNIGLISFPTKHDWHDPSSLSLIYASAQEVLSISWTYNLKDIILPPPGCGNGGLRWEQVGPVLSQVFDIGGIAQLINEDRFTVIFEG